MFKFSLNIYIYIYIYIYERGLKVPKESKDREELRILGAHTFSWKDQKRIEN